MKNQILDWLSDSKHATLHHKEDGNGYIEHRQDVEPILEYVKHKAQLPEDKDFKYIGEIPQVVLDQALIEGWAHDHKKLRKWIAENPKFSAKWYQ